MATHRAFVALASFALLLASCAIAPGLHYAALGHEFLSNLGVQIDNGVPDLGTAGDPGGNGFGPVTGPAIRHLGNTDIVAIGNPWQHDPPTEGGDIDIQGTGSVQWGPDPGDVYP
jgi:hypothetical protein